MHRLLKRLGNEEAPSIDEETQRGENDIQFTKTKGVPYYSLTQVLENKKSLPKANIHQTIHKSVRPVKSLEDIGSQPVIKPQEEKKGLPTANEKLPETTAITKISRYEDGEQIGEGGTAIVYRAKDLRLNRDIALKRFKSDKNSNNESDYLAELESVSRIRHPNVVSTFDADTDERGSFIVMELIDGVDAEKLIQQSSTTFDVERLIHFAIQSLEGLHATHQGGLLHLDIKPSNIMISTQVSGRETVKLVDYGRAALIVDEQGNPPKGDGVKGSIHYLSPEQLLAEPLDGRSDLYSMGCVFYWLLTGKRPFEGENAILVMSSHLQGTVTPVIEDQPSLPQWLCSWVMLLISTDVNKRPDSAQHAIDLLMNRQKAESETVQNS